jgi:hypothetical protein
MGSGQLTVLRILAICRVTFSIFSRVSMCMEDLYAVTNVLITWAVVIFFPSRPSSISRGINGAHGQGFLFQQEDCI